MTSTDHPQPLGNIHTSIPEELSHETSHSDDCPNIPPSLLETDLNDRALPIDTLQSQGALPSEQLSFLTLNVQKVGSTNPSLTNIGLTHSKLFTLYGDPFSTQQRIAYAHTA